MRLYRNEAELDLLATLGHERKTALFFSCPLSTNERVSEVIVACWLNMHYIDELPKGSRSDDLCDGLGVRRIP